MTQSQSVPLSTIRPNQTGIICHLVGGHHLMSRLATLGFTPGAELTMVQNYGWGPLIVEIRGTRIALGRGEASKVNVTPMHAGDNP